MQKPMPSAPKERINIVYKTAGEGQSEVELPLKILMMGDYFQRQDPRQLEDRKPMSIAKDNFNEVMASSQLSLIFSTPNRLPGADDSAELPVQLRFRHIKDFEPDELARQIPALNELLQLREALISLKSPLGNLPAFRKKLQALLQEGEARSSLCHELGIEEGLWVKKNIPQESVLENPGLEKMPKEAAKTSEDFSQTPVLGAAHGS